ncbi:DUF5995 family protein [Streptomyces sp. NBC_01387]|uniref:DUF5995 family protein n=1 Tax=Streptomyces sp. NBC_01387 TaxID=2903849 RepID=UPI003867A1CF
MAQTEHFAARSARSGPPVDGLSVDGLSVDGLSVDGLSVDGPPVDRLSARMRAVGASWPPADGVAVFDGMYRRCLTAAQESVGHQRGGRRHGGQQAFTDPRCASTLDVVFAGRYLAAVDAVADGRRPPACWRPLFQYRHHPGVRPVQFALAGLNAHMGHDLALAVVDTCRLLDCGPDDLEGDFDRVGETLVLLEERIREELLPGPGLLEIVDPLTHLIGSWSPERARDAAWSAARILWELRELPVLAGEFTERMDADAGLVGRCLLTPLQQPLATKEHTNGDPARSRTAPDEAVRHRP